MEKEQESSLPEKLPDNATVYAECNGSMILTREKEDSQNSNAWEEVKVLRKYTSYDILSFDSRNLIENSEYAAHLGDIWILRQKRNVYLTTVSIWVKIQYSFRAVQHGYTGGKAIFILMRLKFWIIIMYVSTWQHLHRWQYLMKNGEETGLQNEKANYWTVSWIK
jgi:hypothetical protein